MRTDGHGSHSLVSSCSPGYGLAGIPFRVAETSSFAFGWIAGRAAPRGFQWVVRKPECPLIAIGGWAIKRT